ncbi:MAG: thermonuclease family protein [Candidatus Coatesbacteria bacterium]|nr:MAG: thermonuclease family protein [Candidatus Coatesbacteria bacterium]
MRRFFKRPTLIAFSVALAAITGVVISLLAGSRGGGYSVIDGDTIELDDVGPVRYIGIDAPERDEPYYEEAREYNAELLARGEIEYTFDVERHDQYGRTLAYVYVLEETGSRLFVNEELVRAGCARATAIGPNTRFATRFRRAERTARRLRRGLWRGEG